jgi:uncharacterized membrane protein
MTSEKSLYKNGSFNTHALLIISSLIMIASSIYLTQHYFNVVFSSSLKAGSICDINSFFNCDSSTLSSASNIWGVPVSVFGIFTGIMILLGYLFKDEGSEGTIYNFLLVNLIGCIILFIYSLAVLGSLCPFCTLYYIASATSKVLTYLAVLNFKFHQEKLCPPRFRQRIKQ